MNFDSNIFIREINAWRTGANGEPIQQFKDINSDLRLKITHARNNITHEAERLTTLSKKQKENLAAMTSMISNKLKTLKSCVNERILQDVNELVSKVNEKVAAILQLLQRISATLWNYVNELGRWIKDAEGIVTQAIKDTKEIEQKGPGWQNQDKINEKAKEFKDKATDLYWKFEGAKRSVEEGVKSAKIENVEQLTTWKKAGDAAVTKAKRQGAAIGEMVQTKGAGKEDIYKLANDMKTKAENLRAAAKHIKKEIGGWVKTALTQVKDMDEALKKDLYKVKEAVSRQVEGIKTAIGKLYKVVETGDTEGATHNSMVEMVDLIKNKIKTIEGVGGRFVTKPTGLWAISQQVPTYVKTFENFDATVADWVREIVRRMVANNGPLHEHIDMYASEIETLQNNREQLLPKVKEQIITKVIAKVKEIALAHKADLATNGNVETDLKLIKRFLDHFNGQSLQNGVDHIVSAIEKAGELQVDPSKQNVIHNSDLKNAVNIVLHVFSMAAEKMGEQIQKLATDCHLGKINEALTTASDFEEKLKQATGNQSVGTSSSRINFALAVDNAIREVTEELGRKLITAAGDTVTLETTTAFSKYDGFVDQDKVSSLSKSDFEAIKSAGHLPAAIGAIRDTAKTDFENAKNIINNVTSFNTLSEAIATNLSDLLRAFEKVGQSIKVTLSNLKINTIGMKDKGAKAAEGSLQEIQQHLSNLKTNL
ncbi:hypothetical protein, conserved [Babesia bigemina]|uniref:Extracellular matrix-binding ebh n=1 Tax=Babesia bigemina TaxID=5866 RepID=A0A061BSM0_BABBI|nr:hypothetical protein, conserved [Babesia bigemina]CDR71523.1 hypothetical protein, conserved [Babesia bigemina]|eukprot:XP_012770469.1 hypothetical protein, conserved [Babesia bigemina]